MNPLVVSLAMNLSVWPSQLPDVGVSAWSDGMARVQAALPDENSTSRGIGIRIRDTNLALVIRTILGSKTPTDDFVALVNSWGVEEAGALILMMRSNDHQGLEESRWEFIEALGDIDHKASELVRGNFLRRILFGQDFDGDRAAAASSIGNMRLPLAADWLTAQLDREHNPYIRTIIHAKLEHLAGQDAEASAAA